MLNFLRSLRGLAAPDQKRSRVGQLIALHEAGRPVWTPRDYAALAREGYERNPVVHRCVRLIAEAAAQTPLVAKVGGRETPEHPALMLVERPNPRQGGIAFREMLYGHLLVAGNAYVEAGSVGHEPRELFALPDRMRVVPGRDGWAEAYDYTVDGQTMRFRQDEGTTKSVIAPILHLTLFHPVDDHYGLSPIEAAACSLDIHNAAGNWHKALLDNAARPSGALVYDGPDGAGLTQAQFDRLKGELEESFQGARNAGRPLLLEGGLDWKPLSLTPAELDFVAAKGVAAREIALAFGVPPLLLGLPGDNTHANFAEANRAFWRQTAIPLVRRTAQSLAQWLGPAFGDDLTLEPDLDAVEALAEERASLWRRVGAADFLSADEKREAVGYGRGAPATGDDRP
jgi:HK97 family phage portal protein